MWTFNKSYSLGASSTTANFTQPLMNMLLWDATVTITDSTPANKTFASTAVDTTNDVATVTNHGYLTGLKVRLTTTGALPAGLLTATDYYIIAVDPNTVGFATSQANALAGIKIDLTDQGSGNDTIVPQALAGTMVFQKNDATVEGGVVPTSGWFTITTPTTAASQNISATTLNYYDIQAGYSWLKGLLTVTSGQATVTVQLNGKGQ